LFLSRLPLSIPSNIEVRNSLILPHPLTDGDVDRRSIRHGVMAAGVKDPSGCEIRSRIANPFRNEFNDPPPGFERFVLGSGDGQDQCLGRGIEPSSGRLASSTIHCGESLGSPDPASTWRNPIAGASLAHASGFRRDPEIGRRPRDIAAAYRGRGAPG
jgi:hypothetical protein